MRFGRSMATGAGVVIAAMSAACSPSGSGADAGADDDHFRCAAMIGAADQLIRQNVVPDDQDLLQRGLLAAMAHLNAYAIPRQLAEREAFAAVKAERDRLIADLPSEQIVARARICVETAPRT